MKSFQDKQMLDAQIERAGAEACASGEIKQRDTIGLATGRLNRFCSETGGSVFYENILIHTDKFMLKFTPKERQEMLLRRRTDNDSVVEYCEENVEWAHQWLYRFQKCCELESLSARNPFVFFTNYCNRIKSNEGFNNIDVSYLNLFLCAVSDLGFLFDSAAERQVPRLFVSREALIHTKENPDIFFQIHPDVQTSELRPYQFFQSYQLLPSTPKETMRTLMMAEQQCRELQLMLPSRNEYCNYIERTMFPMIEQQQQRLQAYLVSPSQINWTKEQYPDIGRICLNCFLWYMKIRRHLNLDSKKKRALEKAIFNLESAINFQTSKYEQMLDMLLQLSQEEEWRPYSPVLIYRTMTRYQSIISTGTLPTLKDMLKLKLNSPNDNLKPNFDTGRKEYRANILFFQKLCSCLGEYLTDEDRERLWFMYEFTEPFSDELYASSEVISAEPDSDIVVKFISHSNDAKTSKYIFQDLVSILERVNHNLDVSPYDLFPFYRWKESKDAMSKRLYELCKGNDMDRYRNKVNRKGRSPSLWSFVSREIDAFKKREEYAFDLMRLTYYHIAFESDCGYGSGTPTYNWTYSIMEICDDLLDHCPELKNFTKTTDGTSEIVEYAIHRYMLDEIRVHVLDNIRSTAKLWFYSTNFLQIKIESDISDDSLSAEDDNGIINGFLLNNQTH